MNFRDHLFSDLPTRVTAVTLAIPTAYLSQQAIDAPYSVGFFLLILVGVGVPQLWERWPVAYGPPGAVLWTLVASTLMVAVLLGLFFVLQSVIGEFPAAVLGFLVADLGPLWVVATVTE